MKNLIILLGIFVVFYCKAQQNFPLLTSIENIPNMSHLKDTNNELQSFSGTYFSTYNGNQITLYVEKENDKLFNTRGKQIYKDILSIRYIIKNSSGGILQDTKSMAFQPDSLHTIYSLWVTENGTKLTLNYSGTNCGVGWGKIILKKVNTTQISWEYLPNDIVTTADKCPSGTDINIYLPEAKDLLFTKQ